MRLASLSLASFRQRRLRSFVSLSCMAIACAMITLSLSTTKRVRGSLAEFDERALMVRPVNAWMLPYAMVSQIRSALGESADVQWNNGFDIEDKDKGVEYEIYAASDDYFGSYPKSVVEFSPGAREKWLADRQAVIVPVALLARMGWKVGDTVTLPASFGPIQAHIVGTSKGSMSSSLHMRYDYVDALLPRKGRVINIVVRRSADPTATLRTLRERFAASDPSVLIVKERAFSALMMEMSGALPGLIEKVALVFGLSTLLVILTNAIVSLRERRGDFGALRAIGFSRAKVVLVIVAESASLAVMAGVIGCGLPFLLFHEKGLRLGAMALENVTMDPAVTLVVLIGSVVLGALAALFPALSLARENPINLIGDR